MTQIPGPSTGDGTYRQLKNLPEHRCHTVANKTRRPEDLCEPEPDITKDGSGQPENDRIAAYIRKREGYVEPEGISGVMAAERLAGDLGRGMSMLPPPFVDMVATVRHESEYAEEHLRNVIDQLTSGRKYQSPEMLRGEIGRAIDGLATVMVAIKAIRKVVE